jgi:hypothetical protein
VLAEEQHELLWVEQRVVALVVRVVELARRVCGEVVFIGEGRREGVGDWGRQMRVVPICRRP